MRYNIFSVHMIHLTCNNTFTKELSLETINRTCTFVYLWYLVYKFVVQVYWNQKVSLVPDSFGYKCIFILPRHYIFTYKIWNMFTLWFPNEMMWMICLLVKISLNLTAHFQKCSYPIFSVNMQMHVSKSKGTLFTATTNPCKGNVRKSWAKLTMVITDNDKLN